MLALDVRAGMIVELEGQMFQVRAAEHRTGVGKRPGAVRAQFQVRTEGAVTDRRFQAEEKQASGDVERQLRELRYQDGDAFCFMDSTTFERPLILWRFPDAGATLLQPGLRLPVEAIGEEAIGVVAPVGEVHVASTPPPMRQRETSAPKQAVRENGLEVLVPLFIRESELIQIEGATGKDLEGAKEPGKK